MTRPLFRQIYIDILRYIRNKKNPAPIKIKTFEDIKKLGPRVVVIGGGTGLSTLLRGLKKYTENITAVVTVSDDGGGSGVIRHDLGLLPPGDIRNCIMALSNTEPIMKKLLNYRFTDGYLKGQCFGNLFLAALNEIYGSFETAVERMNEVLAVTGRVVPVTTTSVNIEAEFDDGATVTGETNITHYKKGHDVKIKKVRLIPDNPPALESAVSAINNAEMIIIGPGSLYTSIIPNLLVNGVTEAIANSSAVKVYIMNLMTQEGETENYSAYDHVNEIFRHSKKGLFDLCIINNAPVKEKHIKKYAKEDAEPVLFDKGKFKDNNIAFAEFPLLEENEEYTRHDPFLLAGAIMTVFCTHCKRKNLYGVYDRLMIKNEEFLCHFHQT